MSVSTGGIVLRVGGRVEPRTLLPSWIGMGRLLRRPTSNARGMCAVHDLDTARAFMV